MKSIAHLKITTWRGSSIGAVHYYGTIHQDNKRHDVRRTLTSTQAKRLNKQRSEHNWRKGDTTTAFDSYEAVRKTALKSWRKLCPGARVLLLGDHTVADPQPCIDGEPELMRKINNWNDQADLIGRYEVFEEGMTRLGDEYWEFICSLDKEQSS